MNSRVLDSLRRLQDFVLEVGLARAVLALPAARMLALPSTTSDDAISSNIFAVTITEPEIESVSRDFFASGHYSLAVQEASKAVDKYVADRLNMHTLSGTNLMEKVFSPNTPVLAWSACKTSSEQDEQRGYQRLFSGAMLGIRNPVTHEFNWIEDASVALELLVFAQHLIRKAKLAQHPNSWSE